MKYQIDARNEEAETVRAGRTHREVALFRKASFLLLNPLLVLAIL